MVTDANAVKHEDTIRDYFNSSIVKLRKSYTSGDFHRLCADVL